jgi:cytochrome P450
VYIDPDFVPFEPPPRPLGLRHLPKLWRNYIETIPRSAYEQGVTVMPGSNIILASDPELIAEVLAEGADWRWQRRAVAPIFRHEMLLSFVPIFAEMAQRQIERWRAADRGIPVDAAAAMTRTTFDIIVEAMLGGSASLDAESFSGALMQSFHTIPWQIIYVLFSVPEWMPYPRRGRAKRARKFLQSDTQRIVETRRATPSARMDLLDSLIAARDLETGRSMSDEEVANNLLTFIIAGHETTAVALTWTLWLLAKDQAAQQRVVDEVVAVAGNSTITASHVEGLSFCRQVIQESMRLFPPAPGIARQAKTAMELGAMRLAAGTRIHIPVYALHRHVRLWDDPNAFDPDRFTADRVKARSRYAFLPFGGGPRICIGASFAMIEAAVILASMARAFRFQPLAGHKPKPVARVTLRPEGGLPLLIAER